MVIGTTRRSSRWWQIGIGAGRSMLGDGASTRPACSPPRRRHENFPVASRLLPRDVRANLMAIYGFARLADDIGDEAQGTAWRCSTGSRRSSTVPPPATRPTRCSQQLSPVIRGLDLSLDPFRLPDRGQPDGPARQPLSRPSTTWSATACCRPRRWAGSCSAVFGASTPERVALSDKVCIGLQLVEHLQDVGEDAAPRAASTCLLEDMERFGCAEAELSATASGPALRGLVAMEARRGRGAAELRVCPSPRRSRCVPGWRSSASRRGGWRRSTPSTAPVTTCSGSAAARRKLRFAEAGTSGSRRGEPEERRRREHRDRLRLVRDASPGARRRTSPTASGSSRRPERRALSAVYALARRIDDIGDGDGAPEEKLAGLQTRPQGDRPDRLRRRTTRCSWPWRTPPRRYRLPMSCFGEIIDGCEMDVIGTSYETIDDLVGYCRRVAGSVGRLSLAIFGIATTPRRRSRSPMPSAWPSSSRTSCATSSRTAPSGRVYLPSEDAETVGCAPDLTGPAAAGRPARRPRVRPRRRSGSRRDCSCCRCSTAAAVPASPPWRASTGACWRGSSASRSPSPRDACRCRPGRRRLVAARSLAGARP